MVEIILLGHGSRDPLPAARVGEIRKGLLSVHPTLSIRSGFVSYNEPGIYEAVDGAARESDKIVIVPLLLARGMHGGDDLAHIEGYCRAKYPRTDVVITPVIGEAAGLAGILKGNIDAVCQKSGIGGGEVIIVAAARGSSKPGATTGGSRVIELLRNDFPNIIESCMEFGEPRTPAAIAEAKKLAAGLGIKHIVILPYLLFDGVLYSGLKALTASETDCDITVAVAQVIGANPGIMEVIAGLITEGLKS